MGAKPHNRSREATDIGRAVARELERLHPVHTAKHIARRLSEQGEECTVKTAENILAGHLSARTTTRLMLAYGWSLFAPAMAAVTGQTLENFIIEAAETARKERGAATERWRRNAILVGELRGLHSDSAGADRSLP